MSEKLTLTVNRTINAPASKVFQAWADVKMLQQWCAPGEVITKRCDSDFRVGGEYVIEMHDTDGKIFTAVGEYKEIEQDAKIVYSWGWQGPDYTEMQVTITLEEKDGKTELTLFQEGFPNVENRDHHNEGWTACFDNIVALM